MNGLWKNILKINLDNKSYKVVQPPENVYEKYSLGLGIATYLLYNETYEGVEPLGKDNPVIISPGLFVGTGVPTASKTIMTFKSPLTGGFGRAVVGAHLGASLRKSGYDAIVVTGKSDNQVIVKIEDDKVEIIETNDYWNVDAIETQELLREKYGKKYRTCAIGRSGENLSKIAGVDFEGRQAARGGGGAVFGSKNLKAIVVKGSKDIQVHDAEELKELRKKWVAILKDHPATIDDRDYGSGEWWEWHNKERGTCPARNFQWGYFHSVYDNLKEGEKCQLDPYYWSKKYTEKLQPCPACTKPCGRIVALNEGKYAGTKVDGVEYELLFSLGSALQINDFEAVAKLNDICDREGFDGISAGVTVAWGMEAFEKGLLDKNKMEGIDLSFGNADAAIQVIEKMAQRDGYIGELLADGTKAAAEKLGKESDKFAIHVKGLEFPAYDVRGIKGLGLAFAVSTRGACHLSSAAQAWELTGSHWKFDGIDRLSSDWKGYEIKTAEDLTTLYDMFGICKFSRAMYLLEGFSEIYSAITGQKITDGQLMLMGERVYNLQKTFNTREGLTRKDDHLPYRITHEEIPKGASKGAVIKESELNKMLDDYYMARGWSRNGVQTNAKLASLDLLDIVEEKYGAGI